MAIEIVTSWRTLFQLAGAAGKAKIAFDADPTPENEQAWRQAVRAHDDYRDLCLEADRMIHLPDIR